MHKKGQSTLEYAIIVAVVVAALFAIQIYMKRGVQGKLRQSTDDIGAQFEANATGTQVDFEITQQTTSVQTIENQTTTSTLQPGGETMETSGEGVKPWYIPPGGSD
jgi:uncharacterized protein (UPF0333 family)